MQRIKLKENMSAMTKDQEQVIIIKIDRSQTPTQYIVKSHQNTKTLTYADFDTTSIVFATPKQKVFLKMLETKYQTTFTGKTLTELSQFINQYT